MSLSTVKGSVPGKSAAYMDWLQMLSGAVLILFMLSHMTLVSSVLLGTGVMNALAEFFESTGMAQVGGPMIGLIFLFHFYLAARKIPFRLEQQKVFAEHSKRMKHMDTWLWAVQAVSAMIILIMGSIHMWEVLTNLPITAAKSAARVQHWPGLLFDLTMLPLVWLHVGIGFYRIGVKWGFIRRDNREKGKKLAMGLTILFITIGLLTLVRFLTLTTA